MNSFSIHDPHALEIELLVCGHLPKDEMEE